MTRPSLWLSLAFLTVACGTAVVPYGHREMIARELARAHPELGPLVVTCSEPAAAYVTWPAVGLRRTSMFVIAYSYNLDGPSGNRFIDDRGGLAIFDHGRLVTLVTTEGPSIEWIFSPPGFRFRTGLNFLPQAVAQGLPAEVTVQSRQ